MSERVCGECTACCKTHPIRALLKPEGKWCEHCAVGVGCKIYGEHPPECKEYSCWWLDGQLTDDDRPDKLGIVVDAMFCNSLVGAAQIGEPMRPPKKFIVRFWEIKVGSLDKDRVLVLANHLKAQGLVVKLIRPGYSQDIIFATTLQAAATAVAVQYRSCMVDPTFPCLVRYEKGSPEICAGCMENADRFDDDVKAGVAQLVRDSSAMGDPS